MLTPMQHHRFAWTLKHVILRYTQESSIHHKLLLVNIAGFILYSNAMLCMIYYTKGYTIVPFFML